jgi:hypothetical protein
LERASAVAVVDGQAPEVHPRFHLVVEAETCQAIALLTRLLNVRLHVMVLRILAEVEVVELMAAVDTLQSAI